MEHSQGSRVLLILLFLFFSPIPPSYSPAHAEERTWRRVNDLLAAEQKKLDLRLSTPRDSQIPYLPAEQFPFALPYSAEEMGLRAMEFPHSPLWNSLLIDIGTTMTLTGLLHQEVGIVAILYFPQQGFRSHLHETPSGQELFRWLSYSVIPPYPRDEPPNLLIGYRTDHIFITPAETVFFHPGVPPFRSRLQREDRAPNQVGTFEDAIGRNAWEFSWRILGTDVLTHTVRFPVTLKNQLAPDNKGKLIFVPPQEIKLMGNEYPAYTIDSGVPCYVVEATPQREWLPHYSLSKLIYWLDQRVFFPLRIEQYDRTGKLTEITVRIATHANPRLREHGYAMLLELAWDIPHDVMIASIHSVIPREWSEEEKKIFFSHDPMPREWVPQSTNSVAVLNAPEEFYLRPSLDEDKFPEARYIALPPELTARIAAQEREGHLVFQ